MPETVKRHIKRARDLFGARSNWHNHWEDCARIYLTSRSGFTTSHVEGDRRTENLFDGTPMRAARGLANSLSGLLRPQSQKWKWIKAADDKIDESDEFKEWAEEAGDILDAEFARPAARFLQASAEVDIDLAVFGTAVMFVGETKDKQGLLFQSTHLKDSLVMFSDEGLPVGMYRFRKMPVHQAVERWDEENLSKQLQEKFKSKPDEMVEFLHYVVKRENGRPDAFFSKDFPWTHTWVETVTEHRVEDSGFREFPYIVPRWDTSSGEQYGRSPAMIGLPDSLTLQAMGETILVAGQRQASPPLGVPADSAFNAVNTFPDGLTYYDPSLFNGRNPFFEIGTGGNLQITREMQNDYRDQVFAAFFRNVLNLPVDGPQMTATEVNQRKQEFLREVGPSSAGSRPITRRRWWRGLFSFFWLPGVCRKYRSPLKAASSDSNMKARSSASASKSTPPPPDCGATTLRKWPPTPVTPRFWTRSTRTNTPTSRPRPPVFRTI